MSCNFDVQFDNICYKHRMCDKYYVLLIPEATIHIILMNAQEF